MRWSILGALMVGVLVAGGAKAEEPAEMTVVPLPVRSYRLLAMSMDDDGFIWTGAIHQVIHRYDPRTGTIQDVPLPYPTTACACLCVGKKVYVLGQTYPKLIIYDREKGEFQEVPYPSPKPDVWYGTGPVAGRYLYLFDRGTSGLIKWDTETDRGEALPYPYQTPLPLDGQYVPGDGAIWCKVWDLERIAQYIPLGVARFDVNEDQFTGYWEFPDDDAGLEPFTDPESTLFLPWTLKGKIRPFDFQKKRWCKFISVPEYGERFAFMGGPWLHQGRCCYSLSTYNGGSIGCDGKPYHFCNAILQFDPRTHQFRFLTLEVDDRSYYQLAYMLSAGGEFYATGTNIREPDGTLNGNRQGEVVFWQSHKPQGQRP